MNLKWKKNPRRSPHLRWDATILVPAAAAKNIRNVAGLDRPLAAPCGPGQLPATRRAESVFILILVRVVITVLRGVQQMAGPFVAAMVVHGSSFLQFEQR